jgi:hypothetical protein
MLNKTMNTIAINAFNSGKMREKSFRPTQHLIKTEQVDTGSSLV